MNMCDYTAAVFLYIIINKISNCNRIGSSHTFQPQFSAYGTLSDTPIRQVAYKIVTASMFDNPCSRLFLFFHSCEYTKLYKKD